MAEIWNKYANTAARKHGKPGRDVRPKSLTVDMHAHVAVPQVAEIVTPHLKQSTDPLVAELHAGDASLDGKAGSRHPHAHRHDG